MIKALKIIAIGSGVVVFLLVALGVALLNNGPETSVYLGNQIPKHFMSEIRELGLLEEGEAIKYFYSDGLFDIKSGFYFVSNQHLVIYSDVWEEPATVIDFGEIIALDVEYDDSFLDDSMVYIETEAYEMSFPVSSEYGRDKQFVAYIQEQIDARKALKVEEAPLSSEELETAVEPE